MILILCLPGAFGQAPRPAREPDVPKATIAKVKTVPGGGLIFAIRLYAPNTKSLNLSRPPIKIVRDGPPQMGDDDPRPFTLAGSTLRDLESNTVYNCLDLLPDEPYFGPMEVLTAINPGGWLQLGIAFPPLPPPFERNGKKLPYQLLFEIPELKIRTVIKLDPETLKPM